MASSSFQPRRTFFEEHNLSQKERFAYPNVRFTKYFWTVNLNRAAYNKKQAKYLMKLLANAVMKVFVQGDVVAFAAKNHRFNRNFVDDNLLQIAVEIGNNKGRVHAHVIQDIRHRSLLNIDPLDVKLAVEQEIERITNGHVMSVFVNRMIKDSERVLEEYLRKESKEWRNDPVAVKGMWTWKLAAGPNHPWSQILHRKATLPIQPAPGSFNKFLLNFSDDFQF